MLDKCANPACSKTFSQTPRRQGIRDRGSGRLSGGSTSGRARQRQHFWLCKSCCCVLTVILDKARRVQVVLLPASAKPQRRKVRNGAIHHFVQAV